MKFWVLFCTALWLTGAYLHGGTKELGEAAMVLGICGALMLALTRPWEQE